MIKWQLTFIVTLAASFQTGHAADLNCETLPKIEIRDVSNFSEKILANLFLDAKLKTMGTASKVEGSEVLRTLIDMQNSNGVTGLIGRGNCSISVEGNGSKQSPYLIKYNDGTTAAFSTSVSVLKSDFYFRSERSSEKVGAVTPDKKTHQNFTVVPMNLRSVEFQRSETADSFLAIYTSSNLPGKVWIKVDGSICELTAPLI